MPLNAEAALENETGWLEYCQDFGYPSDDDKLPDRLICPVVRCMAPPPLACVDNQCVFEEVETLTSP